MKAKFKKIMASLLSAMMVFTMCIATSVQAAENGGTGQITLKLQESTAIQNFNGRTFELYQLFDLTTDATRLDEEAKNFSYTFINDDELKQAIHTAIVNSGQTLDLNENASAYVDKLKKIEQDKKTTTFANELHKLIKDIPSVRPVETYNGGTNGDTSYVFSNLKEGYYVVVETTDTNDTVSKKENTTTSVAMLTNVYVGQNGNPTIELKATLPTIDKKIIKDGVEVEGTDYKVGETVSFKLTATAPTTEYMAPFTEYKFNFVDTLSTGLTLNKESIKVKVNDEALLESVSDYVVEYDEANQKFTVKIPNLKLHAANFGANTVTVEYTATINKDAARIENNKAHIEYSNNPSTNDEGTSIDDEVKVYNFELDINKTDGQNSLTGAKFKLYLDENGEVGNAITATRTNGDYTYEKADGSQPTEFDVNESGALKIKGLSQGVYWLEETKAPDGYNKLTEKIKVTISATYNETTGEIETLTIKQNDELPVSGFDQVVSMTVVNKSGTILPSTGGMGTTILYIAGILAMAGGVCYFVMDKKKRAQK